jgi:hypothetical protein
MAGELLLSFALRQVAADASSQGRTLDQASRESAREKANE